jgi:hypothetical protein
VPSGQYREALGTRGGSEAPVEGDEGKVAKFFHRKHRCCELKRVGRLQGVPLKKR